MSTTACAKCLKSRHTYSLTDRIGLRLDALGAAHRARSGNTRCRESDQVHAHLAARDERCWEVDGRDVTWRMVRGH